MRRALVCLLTAIGFFAALSWHRPDAHISGAHISGALAGEAEVAPAADFPVLYQRWQQTQDPEQKITLGEQLLAAEPRLATWPLVTEREAVSGELHFTVGSLYVNRALGVRADNAERAVVLLEAALKVMTREKDPQNWAATLTNLGSAYQARIRGERAENQERAIAHFEAALTVLTPEAYPQQRAQVENNLAVVYWNRISGERAANLEASIRSFEAAIKVLTREASPYFWAAAEMNLGNAYQARVLGARADNREQSIAHIEAALSVFTREAFPREWAQAQNNLAAAYLGRLQGEAAANQEKAITLQEAVLTVYTRDAFPYEWATTQRGVGNAYADRIRGARPANRAKAIAAYEAALSVFTRDASPLENLRTARKLAHQHATAGDWKKAGAVHADAREAFLMLFGQGLDDVESRALIAEAGPQFADSAFAAAARGDAEAALALADEGRARLLAVSLKLQSLALSADDSRRLDGLRAAIRAGQQAVDGAQGAERAAAVDKLSGLRRELLALVENGAESAEPQRSTLSKAREIVASGGAIAVPIVTDFGGKILIVAKAASGKEITVVDLPELTVKRVAELLIGPFEGPTAGWTAAYFVNYLDATERNRRWPEWTGAIDRLGPELWRLFGAPLDAALKERGLKSGARLVWLPSGWLGVLPLGLAQNPAGKRRLADAYEIAYAPSLEALATASRSIAKAGPPTLAAIINPTGDLPGTEKEGAVVASHFAEGSRTVLERRAATPEAVLAALKGRTHWHFASHGTFSWVDARQSALVMSGPARLSVGRLLETDGLGHPRLVVLSACETGLADITSNPDEFIGLPGTFTALGAAGVLGTLWPVNDAATALLMAKFYDLHMGEGLAPPAALSKAQAWLRKATDADLDAYARSAAAAGRLQSRQLAEIKEDLSADSLARSCNCGLEKPAIGNSQAAGQAGSIDREPRYAHPYFWAGFILTGL